MTDRPAPGTGYIVLLLGMIVGCGVVFVAVWADVRDAVQVEQVGAVVLSVALAALPLIPLHAALRTSYERSGRVLRLRSGFVIRAEISCDDVAAVERVGFIPRVLGWGGGRGLANRLTDGLRITLESGAVYYISPSDPDAFARDIMANIEAPAGERGPEAPR